LYLANLLYVVDENILEGRLQFLKKSSKCLVVTNKEVLFDLNADKINYMVMFRVQEVGRSHNI